jgi:hypothetical protein
MSRFNTRDHQSRAAASISTSPLGTTSQKAPDGRTYEGGLGWKLNPKTDLFLRASASFADGGNTFYETGEKRDETLRQLVRQVAVEDFGWFAEFVKWLRRTANIRTAAIMIACDGVKANLDAGVSVVYPNIDTHPFVSYSNRSVIDSVLYRADEPGELLAYWTATHGRKIPKPVKRGVADAVRRLYNERSLLKYDTASHSFRFADVLELTHASPADGKPYQSALFKYALDRRHDRAPAHTELPDSLSIIRHNGWLRDQAANGVYSHLLDPEILKDASMTWEDALSLAGSKVDKSKLWEAMIPSMGYMALLRNLRNFDEAGISTKVANQVVAKLQDPEEVAKSRQLPFRFFSAFSNVQSLRWGHALETALDLCMPNIPEFDGRTLVLIDSSGSMSSKMSGKSSLSCFTAAALFGAAVALRNAGRVDLHHFADYAAPIPVPRGGSVLRLTKDIVGRQSSVGWGTNIGPSIQATYSKHDRVFVFTDGQTFGGYGRDVAASVPSNVPVYAFNLVGYSTSPMPTGGAARFSLGGLSDQTFKLIPLLETGASSGWPWETQG